MHSTRLAALRRAALTTMAGAALALTLMLTLPGSTATAATKQGGPCANRLCTKYQANTPSCWKQHGRSKVARCFIARAASHFRQSKSQAYHIAWRESRYNWRVTNSSSGAAGLYQFMPRTWHSTPYHKHSPYHPRWAALAAMWMWAHGGYSHWR
jgi:soluble lytic murein transglycosylase-like protein